MKFHPSDTIYLLILLVALGATAWGMVRAREWAFATYGDSESQTEWNDWREDVKKHVDNPRAVKRRVPQSTEPPALVLMRDYFPICLTGALGLTFVLTGALLFLVRGVLNQREPFVDHSAPQ